MILILCVDSLLLMWSKVGPTNKKTTDVGSSVGVSSLSGKLRAIV
jgi:hypothetical protein